MGINKVVIEKRQKETDKSLSIPLYERGKYKEKGNKDIATKGTKSAKANTKARKFEDT